MKNAGDVAQVVSSQPEGILLRVKVVPGASRTKVAGVLGDRLKVAVAAPPEDGKANRAVCELIAEVFGVALRAVTLAEGRTQPRKTVAVEGVTLCAAVEMLRSVTRE